MCNRGTEQIYLSEVYLIMLRIGHIALPNKATYLTIGQEVHRFWREKKKKKILSCQKEKPEKSFFLFNELSLLYGY